MNHTKTAKLMSFDLSLNIKASQLKTVGNWLFLYRKDLFDEDGTKKVECYALPCGPDTFEAYTDIPYDASPFAATKEVRAKAVDALNKDYASYLKCIGKHDDAEEFLTGKRPFGYGLLAVSGGCSMSGSHDLIVLNGDHFEAVQDFLRYQLEWALLCVGDDHAARIDFFHNVDNAGVRSNMMELGIFGWNCHYQNQWTLVELSNGKLANNDFGFEINTINWLTPPGGKLRPWREQDEAQMRVG